jgi:hypothetical protein
MEIPNMGIRNISIPKQGIPEVGVWQIAPPVVNFIDVPVTVDIGSPIVNMPGCVRSHPDGGPQLANDDPKGTKTFCSNEYPSYDAMDYSPEDLVFTTEEDVPVVKSPEVPETKVPEVPKTKEPIAECPTRAQQLKDPIGKILEGNRKIVAYETVGKECLPVFEELSIPDQIVQNIPSAGMITTTASIAVVATSSALLAKPLVDLLLKVVKPTVKKVMKKIAAIRGKSVKVESLKERRGQQRLRNKAIRVLKGRE